MTHCDASCRAVTTPISRPCGDRTRQLLLATTPTPPASPWVHDADFFAGLPGAVAKERGGLWWAPTHSKGGTPETRSLPSSGASDGSGSASESPWSRKQSKEALRREGPPGLELPPQEGKWSRRKSGRQGPKPPCAPTPPPGLEPAVDGPTLVQVFKELRLEDPACILKLRKVQHLGQRPKSAIQKHFQQQVALKEVHVVYSQMKVFVKGDMTVRCKPTGMAFLVLQQPEEARALSRTAEHIVDGHAILLEAFKDLETAGDAGAQVHKDDQKTQLAVEARFSL